jgi:hypothetical protein
LNNFDTEELKEAPSFQHVFNDTRNVQKFLIKAHSTALKNFKIDDMADFMATMERFKAKN